jgi:hypothetical protein
MATSNYLVEFEKKIELMNHTSFLSDFHVVEQLCFGI